MKKLLMLAGPSAVGKTTLADYMIKGGAPFELVRSATTRPPRGDGHDGEYIYLTEAEFVKAKQSGGMLESTEYAGALYGTPASEIKRIFREGKIPLLILDIEGVRSIKSLDKYPSLAVYLFDGIDVLEQRLYSRYLGENPTVEGLSRFICRKERNLAEFADIANIALIFDALVDNSELETSKDVVLFAYENGVPKVEKQILIDKIKRMLEEKELKKRANG